MSRNIILSLVLVIVMIEQAPSAEPAPPPELPKPAVRREPVASKVMLPTLSEAGTPVRDIKQDGYRVVLDLAGQVIALHIPKDESWRSPGELRAGDVVSVSSRSTSLKVGADVQASLARGRKLTVSKVQGDWLGVGVVENGRKLSGWIPRTDVKFESEEPQVLPTLAGLTNGRFMPAAVLVQKGKQFDDGLYAAADLAAQQGAGDFAGKVQLLSKVAQQVAAASQPDEAVLTIVAAARLGGLKLQLPAELERRVTATISAFQADPLRSKPIAFYTWTPELTRIFQQDRMLQTELKGQAGIAAIVKAIKSDPQSQATYEGYLNLVSRLTNPLVKPDLRPLLAGEDAAGKKLHFFPPSRSHEAELIKKLYGDRPIPEGFTLIDELIKRIRAGSIDLKPTQESGWYDHQTWAMEPLVIPEKMPEASHLRINEEYRKHLEELFKGVMALTRETHIKQLEVPLAAAAAPPIRERKIELYINPELCVEPLAESYVRRALSYRFVRGVLEGTFGPEALAKMHRQTANGPVEMTLADELREMESLFHGAYVASRLQLGMPPDAAVSDGLGQGAQADAAKFLHWAANLDLDVDLAIDARMMVPVFFDLQRKQTKVWAFLGWSQQSVHCAYATAPKYQATNSAGETVGPDKVEVHFVSQYEQLLTPIVAELYVNKILNRDEFRQHCDAYKSRSAILGNL